MEKNIVRVLRKTRMFPKRNKGLNSEGTVTVDQIELLFRRSLRLPPRAAEQSNYTVTSGGESGAAAGRPPAQMHSFQTFEKVLS